MAADRLPDPAQAWDDAYNDAVQRRDWQECDRLLDERDYAPPVSAAVSPAEPPERYMISDERLAEIRALISHDPHGYRTIPASPFVSSFDLAAAVEDLLAERDERTDA